MRRLVAATAGVLALLAGCTSHPPTGTPTAVHNEGLMTEDCPALVPSAPNSGAAVDYVDFIKAFGLDYLAGFAGRPMTVHRRDLGRVVLRSRCSLSALNDRTNKAPGPARNGDTAFLKPGTPIYAINGWPIRCRLAARSGSEFRVYLAQEPNTKHVTPRPCAIRH